MGFVLCILHSHAMALAAAAPAADRPAVAYLMTDEAALPYALSDLAAQLADRGLLAATVSAGQAFGAEIESVNVASGALALRDRGLTRVVVSPGPGHAGTETALGFATLAQAGHAALLSALGADVALAVRASERDSRARHRGVSHHTRTLVALTPEAVAVPVPTASALPARGPGESPAEWPASARARLRPFDPVDVAGALTHHRLPIATMGVPLADDSLACAFLGAAAAWLAQPPQ
ncbi:MAG TPA: hypothetical protein DEP66_07055 [Acidimicrobiaceae bacterium]|nr:hypothetical protein [Acidimicrobiaceae bacterium]HCB37937.1 hypothetical protein [Acidimicrobiaceae bacterium]